VGREIRGRKDKLSNCLLRWEFGFFSEKEENTLRFKFFLKKKIYVIFGDTQNP